MKSFALSFLLLCSAAGVFAQLPQPGSGTVTILKCTGEVSRSLDGKSWEKITAGTVVAEGTLLRTVAGSSADMMLQYNGSVFRLAQESELRVEELKRCETGVDTVTETRLKVVRGNLVGSQRKLHKPSILEIATVNGRAFIVGTEYVVNAAGAVTVISGSVEVNFNLPGNKGSVKVTINAGQSFDPATGTVVTTSASHLQNIIADVNAVQANAQVFKAGGATIVVKPSQAHSPTTPQGNNGVGNGVDPQPPGNPPVNDGPGTGPGNPGNGKR